MKKRLAFMLIAALGIIGCYRLDSDQAGASDFPNALQGCITSNNQPIAQAKIRLFRSPIASSMATPVDSAISDAQGQYEIGYAEAGLYAIEIRTADGLQIAFRDSLTLKNTDTTLAALPLQEVTLFRDTLPAGLASLASTLWAKGTPWTAPIRADGSYQLSIPNQGRYTLLAINSTPSLEAFQVGLLSANTGSNNIAAWLTIAPDTTLILNDTLQLPKALLLPGSTALAWSATGENNGCNDSLYALLAEQWILQVSDSVITPQESSCTCEKVSPGIPNCTFAIPVGTPLNGPVTLSHRATPTQSADSSITFHIVTLPD